jgi:hypothetical protein
VSYPVKSARYALSANWIDVLPYPAGGNGPRRARDPRRLNTFPFNERESSPQYQTASNIHHQRIFKAPLVIISNYVPFINEICPYPRHFGGKSYLDECFFVLSDIAQSKAVGPFASFYSLRERRPVFPPATHFTPMAIARRWPTIIARR